jgi:hypothetical protein
MIKLKTTDSLRRGHFHLTSRWGRSDHHFQHPTILVVMQEFLKKPSRNQVFKSGETKPILLQNSLTASILSFNSFSNA